MNNVRTALLLLACAIASAGTPGAANAQMPRIAVVDYYGTRTVPAAALGEALGIGVGDTLTGTRDELSARLLKVPGVRSVHIAPVCCENGGTILYIGIQETARPPLEWRLTPTGPQRFPDAITATGAALNDALMEGVQKGVAGEDDTRGYSLFTYPLARSIQTNLVAWVGRNTQLVRTVLNNSADADQRALAAEVLAYASDRAMIVSELGGAMRDPSPEVRNNAMRGLGVLAMYAAAHPEEKLVVPVDAFVDLLNSLEWTDRNKASFALMTLTESRDPALMTQLRARALDALADMAQWKVLGHATPAALILGRIARMTDDEIMRAMQTDRLSIVEAARRVGR